ncbi:MAG: phosphocholine cytidylyltransferase family protein [Clostridia bacterium]|nr:phosphocholine cytidylyltransferase family protein [Clostridia bacterium]
MKALILAAGVGSRLAPLTDHMPKSLVEVNGTPILMKQIENLHACGITDITVVSGYLSHVLADAVGGKYPEIRILESVDYAITNNMYSAYLAREAMAGQGFLMMNADVFFDASVIRALVDCPHPNAIVVDVGRYMEESMKVMERNGKLTAIAKTIPSAQALGCSIDVYKFSPAAADAFFAKCSEYIEANNDRKQWSEVALNDILTEVDFYACPLRGRWLEIDTQDDLFAAEKLFASY